MFQKVVDFIDIDRKPNLIKPLRNIIGFRNF